MGEREILNDQRLRTRALNTVRNSGKSPALPGEISQPSPLKKILTALGIFLSALACGSALVLALYGLLLLLRI